MLKAFLTSWNPFAKPLAHEIAKDSIEEFQRQYLTHLNSAAYHAKLAEYYREGITSMAAFQPVVK